MRLEPDLRLVAGLARTALARVALALVCAAAASGALAVQRCELNGESVNPNNGNTTAGKTGLMRCRDADTGQLQREQELRNGVFMGVVRFYRDGVLEREHRVNEKGNQDGLSREYAPPAVAGGKPVLVAEDTLANSRTVGLSRRWYPTGTLKRIAFLDESPNAVAEAEFQADGRLAELRCGKRPVLGPDFDDATACGFAGESVVATYSSKGVVRSRTTFRAGVPVRSESLYDSGKTRDLQERSADGGGTKAFAADGTLRRETQWLGGGEKPGERRRVQTLDREFHESGPRVRERRWRVVERNGDRYGELVAEETWYLNGQPKERIVYAGDGAQATRTETRFHDNGVKSLEGTWAIASPGNTRSFRDDRPVGTHRSFDPDGRVRAESTYDERGKLVRERELDASGVVVRDDEVFEDGSRKSSGKARGVGT